MSRILLAGMCGLAVAASVWAEEPQSAATVVIEKCMIRVVDRAMVAAEREGIVRSIDIAVGDEVAEDEQLLSLKDDLAVATMNVAEARAKADVDIRWSAAFEDASRVEFERYIKLKDQEASFEKEYNRARLELERAKFSREQASLQQQLAELEAQQARTTLEGYRIRAPFAGTVTRVLKRPGESVVNGEPVAELVNTDRVQVEGYGRVVDLWRIRRGAAVTVQLDAPELASAGIVVPPCAGKVILVDVVVQPVTETVRIVAEVENVDNLLRDGLKARMSIRPALRGEDDAEPAKASTAAR
ncbi:MAG: efflux RND transporter periplasmic adaptor subunit [Planctomyces sp.]|nr:efflux RND transporter periplasmic adaptor subunit [Planctomyces sp.]